MHEDPEGVDVEEEEVCHGVGKRNVKKLVEETTGMTTLWCDRDACFCDRVNLDRARPLSHVTTRDSGVCPVYILRRLQWISSTLNEIQLHRGKNQLRPLRGV